MRWWEFSPCRKIEIKGIAKFSKLYS